MTAARKAVRAAQPTTKAAKSAVAKPAPAQPAASARAGRAGAPARVVVERVQTGFRMEKRLLKVLKAVAEYHDMALGDLVEGIVLHAFDGRSAFGRESMHRISEFKRLYGLELDSSHAHKLVETE
jgi:predicted DNA-binding ribbon-helix-helix protein